MLLQLAWQYKGTSLCEEVPDEPMQRCSHCGRSFWARRLQVQSAFVNLCHFKILQAMNFVWSSRPSRTKVGLSFGWKHCNPLETPTNNVSCACTCGCTRYSNLMTLEPKTQGHRVNMCQVWTGAWIYLQGHTPRGGTNATNVALSCSCKVFSSATVSILLYVGFAPVVLTLQQANIESAEWMQHK